MTPRELTIGQYRVLSTLGEGGMGTVYLAEQREPVRRRVAVKVIKLGLDSKAVVARFEQERQALAVMSHDGIARVFDCGTTELGQPYFVMEYVKGVAITEYCDRQKLALPERLHLFQQVCSAVQHAHQKGVVHRDLKPGNVLVTDEGGKPAPKIIDFGLARATDRLGWQQSLFTEVGQMLGTPEYMSPEQASAGGDVDTRTDIYSLGVMLYELLSGHLPFPAEKLRRAGLLEMQRVIREEEPPRPSTRLSAPGTAATVSADRRTSARTLHRLLRNDLDWVVLKSMEKDRTRRYESAAGLALDLQRFLDHEPLLAGPPSAGYRLRKLLRRHRGPVTAAAVVLITAIAGAAVAVGYAIEADRNALAARTSADAARDSATRADAAAADAVRQRDAARRSGYFASIAAATAAFREHRVALVQTRLADAAEELRGFEWGYLAAAADPSLRVLRGHQGAVGCARFSADGKRVVTGSVDHTARVWDASSGEQVAVLRGHENQVLGAAFGADDTRVVTTSSDSVRLWDAATGVEVATLGRGRDLRAWFRPDGQQIAILDRAGGKTCLYDAVSGQQVVALPPAGDRVRLVWSADGKWLAASGHSESWIHDPVSGALLATVPGSAAALSPDGLRIVTASKEGARVLEWGSGKQVAVLRHLDGVAEALYSPDGARILTLGSYDVTPCLWDASTGSQLASLAGHQLAQAVGIAGIVGAAFRPDGRCVMTWASDRTVRLWDITPEPLPRAVLAHDAVPWAAAFSPDGQSVVTCDADTARIWDVKTKNFVSFFGEGQRLLSGSGSPNGERVVVDGRTRSKPEIWDVTTGDRVAVLVGHDGAVVDASFRPDGMRIATASTDKSVRIWDPRSGRQLAVLQGHEGGVRTASFSPEGARLVTASDDKSARVWDLATGQTSVVLYGHEGPVWAASFSPDGTRVATTSEDRTVRLWDPVSGRECAVLRGHEKVVTAASFCRDGSRLVTAGTATNTETDEAETIARLWDVHAGGLIAELRGHEDHLTRVVFSPDGRRILTASFDGTARLWDGLTGRELAVLRHANRVFGAAFSPDGTRVVTSALDMTVRIWELAGAREIAVLEGVPFFPDNACFSADGSRILTTSAYGARLWDSVPLRVRLTQRGR